MTTADKLTKHVCEQLIDIPCLKTPSGIHQSAVWNLMGTIHPIVSSSNITSAD